MGATLWFILSILLCSHVCDAAKVLVVFPIPARSHANLGDGVVRNLLRAGHEVTYITVYGFKNPPKNLRQIDVSSNQDVIPADTLTIKSVMSNEIIMNDYSFLRFMMNTLNAKTIENENVQKLLTDPKENFDVVIVEWMASEITAGIATIYDCPLIWVSPAEISSDLISLIDAIPNPAYTGDIMTSMTPPYSFQQRLENLWSRLKINYAKYMYLNNVESKEFDRLIAPIVRMKGRQPPLYEEVRYNASLILGNSHVSMGQAIRLPQNYKSIGGYHIDSDVAPLPEDLRKIMDDANNGVIYFSMGSNLKSKDWPEDLKKGLLKMFGGLKQTVLWKFEEDLPDLPKNVHILQWAPQPSILSHPNCILFISHGGLLSTTEAIHFGVPIIGVPVFGDQFINVKRAVEKGFAKKVALSLDVVEDMQSAINEIISDSMYRERVKELSLIYHDRPVSPSKELVHWVQHVVRTRGAVHLRSPALHVPLYQQLYLDLAALIMSVFIVFYVLLRRFVRRNRVEKMKRQ